MSQYLSLPAAGDAQIPDAEFVEEEGTSTAMIVVDRHDLARAADRVQQVPPDLKPAVALLKLAYRRLHDTSTESNPNSNTPVELQSEVEKVCANPQHFAQHAALYISRNHDQVVQAIQQGFHPDGRTTTSAKQVTDFIFNQILYPAVSDQVKFKLTQPVELNRDQGGRNLALRQLLRGPLSDIFFRPDQSLRSFYTHCTGYNSHLSINDGGEKSTAKDATNMSDYDFVNLLGEIILKDKDEVSLKDFFHLIRSTFNPNSKGDSRAGLNGYKEQTLDDIYGSIGSLIFAHLYKSQTDKVKMRQTQDLIDLNSSEKINEFLDELMAFLAGIPRAGYLPLLERDKSKARVQLDPTLGQVFEQFSSLDQIFAGFPDVKRQLEIYMIRRGVAEGCYKTVDTGKEPDDQPAQQQLALATKTTTNVRPANAQTFFRLMDKGIFNGAVTDSHLAPYDQAGDSQTVREFFHGKFGKYVDPETKPSKVGLRIMYEEMGSVLEEIQDLYDLIFNLFQLFEVAKMLYRSQDDQRHERGNVLFGLIKSEVQRLNLIVENISAKINIPNFNIDAIRDRAVNLGILLNNGRLEEAFAFAKELADAIDDGSNAAGEVEEVLGR